MLTFGSGVSAELSRTRPSYLHSGAAMSLALPKDLIFLTTLRCPLECAHCIVDSSPRRTESIHPDLLYSLIEQAADLGVSTIGFTGGDPFVRPRELETAVRTAKERGLRVVIVSSAFWAGTPSQARRMLLPFREIDMLGISTDGFHDQFVSLEHIRHALQAAKDYRIPTIEVQVTSLYASARDSVRSALGVAHEDVPIRWQRLWPVGRAAPLILGHEDSLVPLASLNLDCPMGPPVITPDLKLKGCCSSLLNLGASNPIILGDLAKEDLSTALQRATTHSYYLYLKTFGVAPLVEILTRKGRSAALAPAYSDVCHLCHDIHSRKDLLELLVSEVAGSWHTRSSPSRKA